MNFDYIVEGTIFINGSFQQCCLGIESEKIVTIKKVLTGSKKVTFPKKKILPAGIDIHVHFRDPGFPDKETFKTGSTAAAFGGISCVFDMPNTQPQTTKKNHIVSKISHAEKTSLIDFGIYAGISNENIPHIRTLVDLVPGFKVFLAGSTNSLYFSKDHLSSLFEQLKDISNPVLFHAEDATCIEQHKRKEHSLYDHHLARPDSCELQSVKNLLLHAPFPCPVHICHVSSSETVRFLTQQSTPISFGVTPHHCLLSSDTNHSRLYSSYGKVNPPLRPQQHQQMIFQELKKNHVPIIESDHAPHTVKQKQQPFYEAPCGISGVETMYPLFLNLAYQQSLSFSTVIRGLCEKPANLFGLSKGYIKEGFDADFIVVDFKNSQQISSDALHSKCMITPFIGWSAIFPETVFIRGEKVIEDDEILVKHGFGRNIGE